MATPKVKLWLNVSDYITGLNSPPPMTTQDHRKTRLRHLIATDYGGKQAHMAAASPLKDDGEHEYNRSRINQLAGDAEPFGEGAARKLEESYGLPKGWFNNLWPTPREAERLGVPMEAGYPTADNRHAMPTIEQAFEVFARALSRISQKERRDRVLNATGAYASDPDNEIVERDYVIRTLSGGSRPDEGVEQDQRAA